MFGGGTGEQATPTHANLDLRGLMVGHDLPIGAQVRRVHAKAGDDECSRQRRQDKRRQNQHERSKGQFPQPA